VIEERAQREVVRHQPKLGARVARRHVGADEAENIFMAEQNGAEK